MILPLLSLYIHIPWCVRKCPYCDFNSHEAESIPEQQYIDALLLDLELDLELAQGRELHSIFIGGGTPSLFSANAINKLLCGINTKLSFAKDIEITMEANPGTAEAVRFKAYQVAGINRLSIGVQSFDDKHLKKLGRIHSAKQAISAVEMAQSAGFDNVNIDLMHGLPQQTAAEACSDIQQAIALQPQHISWYQLTIEPNTQFYNKPPQLPTEGVLDSTQRAGVELLEKNQFLQYEISAYTKDHKRSLHNLNYWRFGDYLGIGAGAHSKITTASTGSIDRYWKRRQPEHYLNNHDKFIAGTRVLNQEDLVMEYMMNSLRLNEGFTFSQFEQHTGLPRDIIASQLLKLQQRELIAIQEERIATTTLGQRFLDSVLQEFFPDQD